jgi:hypothetical protein
MYAIGVLILHKIMKGIEVRIPSVKFSIFELMERRGLEYANIIP